MDGRADEAMGLRERRRRETQEAIHVAAMACIEQHGVAGATVAEIAERAGVAPRTFFRYFPTKEAAVLTVIEARWRAIAKLESVAPDAVVSRLMDVLGEAVEQSAMDAQDHLAIGRLLEAEPRLRAYAARQDAEMVQELVLRLRRVDPSMSADRAGLIAELAMSVWRVTWDGWDREGPTPALPDPSARWETVRSSLAPLAAELGSGPVSG